MKETVQVTREDREAAAALVPLCFGASALWQKNVLAGYYDDGEVVQAFARHRLSATSAPAGVEGLYDAVARIERFLSLMLPQVPLSVRRNCEADMVQIANDFADLRAALQPLAAAPAPSGQSGSFDAAQYAFDQQSDDPQPGDWNDACVHIAEGIRRGGDVSDGEIYARASRRISPPAPSGQEVVHCKTCGERMDSEGIPCADCAFSARTATPPASGVTVPEGMKAWNGGESAPEDWDGGRVLFRDGKTGAYLRKDGGCWSHRVVSPDDIIAYTPKPAALSTPSATPGEDRQRLALEAIKVVTATTKDAVAGLSRIMAIARSAGVDAPYSELMAKPEVALIVNEPRTNWRHLFEQPAECTIPPAGWRCTRKPRHDGPCAAVATATPGEEA